MPRHEIEKEYKKTVTDFRPMPVGLRPGQVNQAITEIIDRGILIPNHESAYVYVWRGF